MANRFRVLAADEATCIRNPETEAWSSCKLLNAPVHILITATPLLDKAADLIGHLKLIYLDEWRPHSVINKPEDRPDEDMFTNHYQRLAADDLELMQPYAFGLMCNPDIGCSSAEYTALPKYIQPLFCQLMLTFLKDPWTFAVEAIHGTNSDGG